MLFLEFAMLLEQIHCVKFVRIPPVKELEKEHVGLYHWKGEHWFEK